MSFAFLNLDPGQTLLLVLGLFAVIYGRRVWRWATTIRADWHAFQAWKASGHQTVLVPMTTASAPAQRPAPVPINLAEIPREPVGGGGGALLHPPQQLDVSRAYMRQRVASGRMSFPIGWWTDQQQIHLAVGHFVGDIYNILVTAMPGSGKDNLILNMAYSLMLDYPADEVQFVVLDGKGGADYLDWAGKQHVFHIAEEGYELAGAMELLSAIKLDRKRWLKQVKASSWDNYQGPDRPPLMIVVISELTQLLDVMSRSEVESWLMREVNVWRGLGLRLVVGTQNTSGWSKEWRAAMECFFAGLQPSADEVRPNTGKSVKELEELKVVPPHKLPNVRGVFTAVHRNTAVNVRTTYLSDDERTRLTLQLPDRTPAQVAQLQQEQARLLAEWDAFKAMIAQQETERENRQLSALMHTPPPTRPAVPLIEPSTAPVAAVAAPSPTPALGYDRRELDRLLYEIQSDRSRRLEELSDHPVFIRACVIEFGRVKSNAGVVKAIWGKDQYSGTKDRVVKAALERGQERQRQDDTLLNGLLAA